MKKKKRIADFFDPHQDLILESEIFCNHRDSKDWFWYTYGMTIREALHGTKDPLSELELIRMALTAYIDVILEQLEGYEEYEWCAKVKAHMKTIYHELFALQMRLENLDK